MENRRIYARGLTLTMLLLCAIVIWNPLQLQAIRDDSYLIVRFLDVGQGDAVFIETSQGTQVLIDGGPDSSVLRELSSVMGFFDHSLDVVVGTHPDKDHIGGLIDVFERYDVGLILTTENESDTNVSQGYVEKRDNEGAEVLYARRGQTLQLDASTTLRVLFPEGDVALMESNASSIVLQLRYGDIEFLLTGDSPKRIEEYLTIVEGEHLESEVLKVGHHGSRTSTSESFLEEVSPDFAVISASGDNTYGHPHVEVTDMLFNHRVETFSTAESGTLTFLSDGMDVWIE